MPTTVPTYSADGKRLRNYSLASIESLLVSDRVAVERNRKGEITCATMRPADKSNPILKSAHMGQSYSFLQNLPSGHRAWSHSRLLDESELTSEGIADAEKFVRDIFFAVPASVSRIEKPLAPVISIEEYRNRSKRLAPVVCIDAFRVRRHASMKRASAARPIEFDSERRVA